MTGAIATIPKFSFSANGVPMVSGTLTVYLAGTTTPTDTWQDQALTALNTNPVTLDARGECVLWLDSTKSYKFVLKNAAGVTQWTQDNISGADAHLRGDLAASSGASLVGYLPAGTGAVATKVQAKLREIVSVKDFGAVGDGVADDTDAIRKTAEAIQAAGGGIVVFPFGKYKIWPANPATPLAAFSSCTNITIESYGAKLLVGHTWSASQKQDVFQFSDCKNLSLGLPEVVSAVQPVNERAQRGPVVVRLLGNCEAITIPKISATGALAVIQATALSSATEAQRTRGIFVGVGVADRCGYGLNFQFSGDDVFVGQWSSAGVHRTYFPYGVRNHVVNIESRDQDAGDVRLQAYEGKGLDNITVNYTNTKTTSAQSAAECIVVSFGDETPASINNIRVNMRLHWPASGQFGNGFVIQKFNNSGSADTLDRGHLLSGLTVSASLTSDFAEAVPFNTKGTWGSGDSWSSIFFRDISVTGANSSFLKLGSAKNSVVFDNVASNYHWYVTEAPQSAPAILRNCKALNFTAATSDTGYAEYFNCEATDGAIQSANNKRFLNFKIAGRAISDYSAPGHGRLIAAKTLDGDLTAARNVFFIKNPAGGGMYYRLSYAAVADNADTNPATRDETYGIKSFTATMNDSGAWAIQTAVQNEVTERTLGTASAVTVSLVNGTSSGAYIAVACSNYNLANARATFVLEAVPMFSGSRLSTSVVAA